ncbi:MAG: hypothetical protein DCC57_03885 [Chloroflexi bacterium]|nr:MAG: hypothetical protein DCC57_03885 [Chloroflexota bacterium]
MNRILASIPGRGWTVLWVGILLAAFWGHSDVQAQSSWTVPSVAPVLSNPDFECADGYTPDVNPAGDATLIPNGWTVSYRSGAPFLSSTRLKYRGGVCDDSGGLPFVEKLNGHDSLTILSQHIEWSDAPGKPFDVVLYQQVPATVGGIYSLSGWLVSICGRNSKPFDCPEGYYIAKAVGLDPNGGTDPDAASVEWVENRDGHVDSNGERLGWQNMRVATRALSNRVTVFVRMSSPFQWHGNLGFVDAFSLVRGPLSELAALPSEVEGNQVEVAWIGQQSPDVLQMAGSTHQLLFDVQARYGRTGEWRDLVTGAVDAGSTTFTAPCVDAAYEFRVRARSEQPEGSSGLWPNQRYPGVWSTPVRVYFNAAQPVEDPATPAVPNVPDGPIRIFIPQVSKAANC